MNTSNSELAAAIVDGELHRYDEIVRRFGVRVRQVISREIVDPATCEDIVQETFCRAFLNLHQLREPEQLESWLVMIARNCITDHFRKSNRRQQRELACGQQMIRMNDNREANDRNASWVWQEVDQLAQPYAQILLLRYQQSMSYSELAKHLNLPESTIRGRLVEARKALRQRLINRRLYP